MLPENMIKSNILVPILTILSSQKSPSQIPCKDQAGEVSEWMYSGVEIQCLPHIEGEIACHI